jgi:alpha-galactosidase
MLSLWSIAKSPLLIGADVRAFDSDTISLLTNAEVIAVNQDALGKQGRWVNRGKGSGGSSGSSSSSSSSSTTTKSSVSSVDNSTQVWAGLLVGGRAAVALVNMDSSKAHNVTLRWDELSPIVYPTPTTGSFSVRDVWAKAGLGTHTGSITLLVEAHDTRMLVIAPGPRRPGVVLGPDSGLEPQRIGPGAGQQM